MNKFGGKYELYTYYGKCKNNVQFISQRTRSEYGLQQVRTEENVI